ncbi:MAG: 3-phosphoshikimate 1-carboxyvinyltransferase [Candidatus Eremiobacteraeota bacterium]|nr:3-phosphoshikimate 1-carboxyvinyltransferase [Candidatus Eremiobacteraeota bacterium]
MRKIIPIKTIKGNFIVPSDKSISHRVIILAALSNGRSLIRNFLFSNDCISTIECFRKLGVTIECRRKDKVGKDNDRENAGEIIIHGRGLKGLCKPPEILDAGNSGTTMRLISGILASTNFLSIITGDDSLRFRPMGRIIKPLKMMGAEIYGRNENKYPPLTIIGKKLKGIEYCLPIPSAQLKSCILLAGLSSEGTTIIEEPVVSRDHTERMLKALGASIKHEGRRIILEEKSKLAPFETWVPGDISSASYLIASALLLPESKISIRNVGLNPTRMGFVNVLKKMGANIRVTKKDTTLLNEPYGEIEVQFGPLNGIKIGADEIPTLIDEIPLLAIIGAKAKGRTIISGAGELRVKETDRISAVVENIRCMGIEIEEREDGFIIDGEQDFKGAMLESRKDHRIAMTFAVAALSAKGETKIKGASIAGISYPGFWELPLFQD